MLRMEMHLRIYVCIVFILEKNMYAPARSELIVYYHFSFFLFFKKVEFMPSKQCNGPCKAWRVDKPNPIRQGWILVSRGLFARYCVRTQHEKYWNSMVYIAL